ncbi:hypothetical protein [Delftia sp.]|uniref:hypothetical protein n=1 Tax=Delftia sp. TaxID=1886637 RepID=UPI00259D19FC|nr:hypothetical protein [Delftia sp.]
MKFFLDAWREAAQWSPSQRRGIPVTTQQCTEQISTALSLQDEQDVYASLLAIKNAAPSSDKIEYRSLILEFLKQLDSAFAEVHPRNGRRRGAAKWVMRAHENRMQTGAYYLDDASYVVACGPLSRANRGEHANSADSLADRFSFLAVVPRYLLQEETRISINIGYISDYIGDGVTSGTRRIGQEVVCAIPIALERSEIEAKMVRRNNTSYVEFSASDNLDPGNKVIDAVSHASKEINALLDISIGSEFLINCDVADSLINKRNSSRLFLLGSGASKDVSEIGQPWNEAIVVNDVGKELWRQRKIWPASVDGKRAVDFQVKGVQPGGPQLFEDICAGDSIEIVDIEGLGRCVILICQDFTAKPLSQTLIRNYQPDWIFAPILDRGFAVGNWFHQYALHYSGFSKSRMIGVTSIALPREGAEPPLSCVMAVCSMEGDDGVPSGAFSCKAPMASHPSYVLIDFKEEKWSFSRIIKS